MEEQIEKRGKGTEESAKEQKGPAHGCTPWSQREEQNSLPPTALTPVSMAVSLANPALSGTSHSRALLWLDSS